MANDITTEELAYQKSCRYLEWQDLFTDKSGSFTISGSAGSDGIDVANYQLAKIAVVPTNATASFNVQYEYEGYAQFLRVDGSERTSVSYPWTQQADISGVSRLFIGVESFTTGSGGGSLTVKIAYGKSSE